MLLAAEDVLAWHGGHVGLARHARGEHELGRVQGHRLPVAVDLDGPLPLRLVVGRAPDRRGAPVGHLHDRGVALEPVSDLVLGGEDRPVVRELQVRHVVVPDRVVQAQGLVAVPPLVAGALVAVDDERGHVELAQAGTQRDAALAAADDEHVRLGGHAHRGVLGLALLLPAQPLGVDPVLGPLRPVLAARLLVALELVEGREEGPCLVLAVLGDEAGEPATPADGRLEGEPGGDHPVLLGGLLRQREAAGGGRARRALEQLAHPLPVLHGGEVPREGDEVAPIALGGEEVHGRGQVLRGQGRLEGAEPGLGPLGRRRRLVLGHLGHDPLLCVVP